MRRLAVRWDSAASAAKPNGVIGRLGLGRKPSPTATPFVALALVAALLVLVGGCHTTEVAQSNLYEFKLYEKDDPEGFRALAECFAGYEPSDVEAFLNKSKRLRPIKQKMSREEAEAVQRMSKKINAGEPLVSADFDGVPCSRTCRRQGACVLRLKLEPTSAVSPVRAG